MSGIYGSCNLASVIVQPVTVSASELEPEPISFEQQYPELQDVQDTLDKDEIVEAKDIEIPYGEEFEVEVDLSGIEGVNEKKVKVLFHEAKSEAIQILTIIQHRIPTKLSMAEPSWSPI